MLRDVIGVAAILAILTSGVYLMPKLDLWARSCGAGIMVQGVGGYWFQSKEECEE